MISPSFGFNRDLYINLNFTLFLKVFLMGFLQMFIPFTLAVLEIRLKIGFSKKKIKISKFWGPRGPGAPNLGPKGPREKKIGYGRAGPNFFSPGALGAQIFFQIGRAHV